MSNPTYSPAAFKPAVSTGLSSLLSQLFKATPLYIFATALKAGQR